MCSLLDSISYFVQWRRMAFSDWSLADSSSLEWIYFDTWGESPRIGGLLSAAAGGLIGSVCTPGRNE